MSKVIVKAFLLAGATLAAVGVSGPATSGVLDPPPAYPVYSDGMGYPSPGYNWTGFYAGINGGGTWGHANWESDPDMTTGRVTGSSGLVGGTIGYNAQTMGRFVAGTEFDFDWRGFDFTIPAATCGPTCDLKSSWLSTARLRFGYAIDRFLPYITGGVSMSNFMASSPGNGVNNNVSFNFTAGGGVEFVVNGPWTAKAEYLFVNHYNIVCVTECNGPVNLKVNENLFRVGLNYRVWER